MLKELLVAGVSAPEVADSVYAPALVIDRALNDARPAAAAAVVVPESVPGPVATARVMLAVEVVRFPLASVICTCTAGAMVAPETVFDGWTTNESAASGPGLMVKVLLVAAVSAPE